MQFRWTLLVVCAAAGTIAADDWPQWLGPKRDGIWRETGIVDQFPAGGPKVLWRTPCGIGYAGPAVAAGKVFLPERILGDGTQNPTNPFGRTAVRGKDRLRCLDEATGKELWLFEHEVEYRVAYAAGPRCTPTVAGDLVIWLGTMGDLFVLDVKTGKPVWEKHYLKDYKAELPQWGFASHPLVDGDRVICQVGGAEAPGVVALDLRTGKEIWRALQIGGDAGYNSPIIIEVQGKRVLVVWHTHAVVGLEPETGKRIWKYDWEISAALTVPTVRQVNETRLFLTSFYNGSLLLDIGGETPKAIWKSKSKGGQSAVMPGNTVDLHSIMPTPWVKDGHVYGVCSYGELRCLELNTGKRIWETHAATAGKSARWANAFLTPHAESDRVFLFNEKGELIIARLTPKGYDEIDRAKVLEPTNPYAAGRTVVWSHPAYANQTAYVRNDREIVAVSLKK